MAEVVNQIIEPSLDDGFFDKFEGDKKQLLIDLFEEFRLQTFDFDKEKNVLNGQQLENTNAAIYRCFTRALRDLNSGSPVTNYEIFNFPDKGLLLDGAVIFYLVGNGLLQLRNQLDYNDAGLTIGMFNKTGLYQSWMQILLQPYFQAKQEFKRAELTRLPNAGFVGIGSEFGYFNGW